MVDILWRPLNVFCWSFQNWCQIIFNKTSNSSINNSLSIIFSCIQLCKLYTDFECFNTGAHDYSLNNIDSLESCYLQNSFSKPFLFIFLISRELFDIRKYCQIILFEKNEIILSNNKCVSGYEITVRLTRRKIKFVIKYFMLFILILKSIYALRSSKDKIWLFMKIMRNIFVNIILILS